MSHPQTKEHLWIRWAVIEAGFRTASRLLQKVVGVVSTLLVHTLWATAIIGAIQTVVAALKLRNVERVSSLKERIGAILFGLGATASTVLAFVVFIKGGDVGIHTFIIALGIIPGAVIDKVFFGERLNSRQWLGILIGVLAGYTILDTPNLSELATLPTWVWLSLTASIAGAINQGITKAIKDINAWSKNFFGGITTMVVCLFGILFLDVGKLTAFDDIAQLSWVSVAIGFSVIGLWIANLYSYRDGAHIAIKNLVTNGIHLTASVIFGILLFSDAATLAKLIAIPLYLVGFVLMDEKTWNYLTGK